VYIGTYYLCIKCIKCNSQTLKSIVNTNCIEVNYIVRGTCTQYNVYLHTKVNDLMI